MKCRFIFAIALLFAVPLAGANPATSTLVRFDHAEHAGLVEIEGDVLAFFKFGEHQLPVHGLKIRADRGLMELDRVTETAHVAGASFNEEQTMESLSFTKGRLVSSPQDEDAYMAILALPGTSPPKLTGTTPCASFQRGPEAVEVSQFIHGRRDQISIPSPSSVNATLCSGTVAIQGSFLLVLWGWNGTVYSAGGEAQDFTTGRTYGTRVDDPRTGTALVYEGERVQAYVTVWDASVQYLFSGASPTLISPTIAESTEGTATLIEGGLAQNWGVLDPVTMELRGHIEGPVRADSENDLLQDVAGTIQFTGETGFVTGAVPESPSTVLLWPFMVFLVALVILLLPTSQAWVRVSRRLSGIGLGRTAIGLATWATLRDRSDAAGFMQRAIARRHAGRLSGAERDLVRAWNLVSTPRNRARVALERARVCSDMDHGEEYAWWLHQVNQLDPSLLDVVDDEDRLVSRKRPRGAGGWMLP